MEDHSSWKGCDEMAMFYVWLALLGVLVLMLTAKAICKAADTAEGTARNWRAYNGMMSALVFLIFFPVMVLIALTKKKK